MDRSDRPVLFFHIAKTGGTSIKQALAPYFDENNRIFDDVTKELLGALSPNNRVFIGGHWTTGTLRQAPSAGLKFTVLRQPRDRVISNYLDICRAHLQLGELARKAGLKGFLKRHPYYLAFQTGSLLVPQTDQPCIGVDDVIAQEKRALAFLDDMDFVGCCEDPEDISFNLPALLGLPDPLTLPRINRASDCGVTEETLRTLRRDYEDLARDPDNARLIAIEERLYEKAATLTRQRRTVLDLNKQMAAVMQSGKGASHRLCFDVADAAIHTDVGEKADGLIRLASRPGCGLYGPYVDLPMGRLTAAIKLVGPRHGSVVMDIAAEAGDLVLASREIRLDEISGDTLELAAELPRPLWHCEVRLFCNSRTQASVAGVEMRLSSGRKHRVAVSARGSTTSCAASYPNPGISPGVSGSND